MEGRVHYCDWKLKNGCFNVFVVGHRASFGEGETFMDAREVLEEVIGAATADGEVQLEFVRETPSELPLIPDECKFVAVYGNDYCGDPDNIAESLYIGGYCAYCRNAVGNRTQVRRVASFCPKGDGALDVRWNPVFSQEFFSLLTPEARKFIEVVEVVMPKHCKRRFFELIGVSIGEFVAKKGEVSDAGQCKVCGYRSIYYGRDDFFYRYVPASSIPKSATCFVAGRSNMLSLCIRADRWQKIRLNKIGTRMLRTTNVFLLEDEKVDYEPQLRLF